MKALKTFLAAITVGWLLVTIAGCDPVREPWVRDPDQLEAERARSAALSEVLNNRLRGIQTDR